MAIPLHRIWRQLTLADGESPHCPTEAYILPRFKLVIFPKGVSPYPGITPVACKKDTTESTTMKRSNMLAARFADTVKRAGHYGDGRGGNGLFLSVKRTADGRLSESRVQGIRVAGRVPPIGLGGYPFSTIEDARRSAMGNR